MIDFEDFKPAADLAATAPRPPSLAMGEKAGVRGQARRFAETFRRSRALPPDSTLCSEFARGRGLEKSSSVRVAA